MSLSGPAPWHAVGTASISILFLTITVSFDVQIGRSEQPSLPEPVDVLALLHAALADVRNWSAELPPAAHPLVTLRDPGGTALLVHPLAVLRVRQRVVPLNRPIARFGSGVPSGDRQFRVDVVAGDGTLPAPTVLRDAFAPAQFESLSDDAKLAAPALEQMDAGLRFGSDDVELDETRAVRSDVVFDTTVVDGGGASAGDRYTPAADVLDALVADGAAAAAPIARSGAGRYAGVAA
jgi:hypothetical protein